MSSPYQYMTTAEQAMTPQDRLSLYNLNPYDSVNNRFGLGEGGQAYLWMAVLADWVALNGNVTNVAQMALSYLAGANGWVQEAAAISRVSSTQFTVVGNRTLIYKPTRAIAITQTASGFGYVSASSYSSGTGMTTVTVSGITVDTGLLGVSFGQDPANAPAPPVIPTPVAQLLYFNANFMTP